MVAYTKPQQGKKEESERLRGERDRERDQNEVDNHAAIRITWRLTSFC